MKLKVTQKRIDANKRNGALGAIAYREKRKALYEANPSFCTHCSVKLPQEKKNNKFCSSSCSATFNNTGRIKVERTPCEFCSKPTSNKYCCKRCAWESQKVYLDPNDAEQYKRLKKREVSYRYYQRIKDQTPPDADLKAIKEFKENCPEGYEVDHIIPISKGGLHTLNNLQYLPMIENRRKSNKIIV
jgi:5-methylcytosine-specific restriction endonuclease McrA